MTSIPPMMTMIDDEMYPDDPYTGPEVHEFDPDPVTGKCRGGWARGGYGTWVSCFSRDRSSVLHIDEEADFRQRHYHGGGDCISPTTIATPVVRTSRATNTMATGKGMVNGAGVGESFLRLNKLRPLIKLQTLSIHSNVYQCLTCILRPSIKLQHMSVH